MEYKPSHAFGLLVSLETCGLKVICVVSLVFVFPRECTFVLELTESLDFEVWVFGSYLRPEFCC